MTGKSQNLITKKRSQTSKKSITKSQKIDHNEFIEDEQQRQQQQQQQQQQQRGRHRGRPQDPQVARGWYIPGQHMLPWVHLDIIAGQYKPTTQPELDASKNRGCLQRSRKTPRSIRMSRFWIVT
jgi:hypothetical protein